MLFASPAVAAIPFAPAGTILIDPWSAVLVASGTFAPPGSAPPRTAELTFPVPPNPALAGQSLHWQMITGGRLSNRITTTIAGY